MRITSFKEDEKILVEIPEEICKLYQLKQHMCFKVKAVEKPSSKLLISFLCDLPE